MFQVGKFLQAAEVSGMTEMDVNGSGVNAQIDIKFAAGAEDFFEFIFGGNNIGHATGE